MTIRRAALIGVMLTFTLLNTGRPSLASGGIEWYSFQEGLSAGQEQGKKAFLHFYADWCGACVQMARETFRDPQVVEYLNVNFISVKVNTDKDARLSNRFGIQGLPTNWFMDAGGDGISHIPGHLPADLFIKVLKFIHTDSYKTMSFDQFERSLP